MLAEIFKFHRRLCRRGILKFSLFLFFLPLGLPQLAYGQFTPPSTQPTVPEEKKSIRERIRRESEPSKSEGLRFLREPSSSAALSADELIEDRERQRVIGRGFVDLRFLGNRIQADHLEVQTETRDGVATGNVVFQTGNDRLVGSRIEFNLDNQRAVIYDARGYIGGVYYITGEVVRRISEDRYEISKGSFTTCEGDTPTWSFQTEKANFQIEGYAILGAPQFRVLGLPVAALPFAIVPIKTKRATGLLPPRYGFSNKNGVFFSPDFFWAINDWSDATFGIDYYSRRGTSYKGEYRYILSPRSRGRFSGSYLRDTLESFSFWDFKGTHGSSFPDGSSLTTDLDFVKREEEDRSLETNIIERTRQNTDTKVNYIKNLVGIPGQFRVGLRRQEGINENEDQLFQRAPELELQINNSRIGTSDFYYAQDSSFVSFFRVENDNTTNLQRFDFAPNFSLPIKTVPWLGVTPRFGLRETVWTDRKANSGVGSNPSRDEQKETLLSRELWSTGINVEGPRFSRVYEGEIGPFRDFKHIIALNGNYSYTPAIDSKDRRLIIPVDAIDESGDTNTLSYGVTNRVLTKLQLEEGFETRQLFTVDLSQTYDIAESRRKQNPETPLRPFGPVVMNIQARPISLVNFTHRLEYSVYEGEISNHTTGLRLDGGKNWYFDFNRTWSLRRNGFPQSGGSSFINLAGGVAVTPRWFIEYSTRLNKIENVTLEQSIIMRYEGCCWGFTLDFTDTPDRSEVFFTVSLLGILEGEKAPTFKRRRNVAEQGRFLGDTVSPLPFEGR